MNRFIKFQKNYYTSFPLSPPSFDLSSLSDLTDVSFYKYITQSQVKVKDNNHHLKNNASQQQCFSKLPKLRETMLHSLLPNYTLQSVRAVGGHTNNSINFNKTFFFVCKRHSLSTIILHFGTFLIVFVSPQRPKQQNNAYNIIAKCRKWQKVLLLSFCNC